MNLNLIDIEESEVAPAGKVPVYDFHFASPERERELARMYPVTDPAIMKDIEEARKQSLNIKMSYD